MPDPRGDDRGKAMTGPKIKFLVVDDLPTMRGVVRDLLKDLGFTDVVEAEDGVAALRELGAARFDCVVTDWKMPKMDGLALLQKIRQTPRWRDLPVLMITAEAEPESRIVATQAGASGYIVKPFSASTLQGALNKIFDAMGGKPTA